VSQGLNTAQLESFEQDGYLVVDDVLSSGDLTAIEGEYAQILGRVTSDLVDLGRLEPLEGSTFGEKFVEALPQLDDMYELYQHLDITLPLFNELPADAAMNAGPAVFGLLTMSKTLGHRRIGDRVRDLLQPGSAHTDKAPQTHLPEYVLDANVAATLWHQDVAVVDHTAGSTNMLTVWLAVTEATIDNGCLVAVEGSHRREATLHCPGKVFPAEIYIPESIINHDLVRPLEVGAGGMILLNKLTEHGSFDNNSDNIRWSFDLRYQRTGQPTGRDVFPGFVARSQTAPESVVGDPDEWANMW